MSANTEFALASEENPLHPIFKPRQMVLKTFFRNELKSKSFSLQVMKLRDYIISEMDPSLKSFVVHIDIAEYYRRQGITRLVNSHYAMLENALHVLRTTDTPIMTMDLNTRTYRLIHTSWIDSYTVIGSLDRKWPQSYEVICKEQITRELMADMDMIDSPQEYSCRMQSKYGYLAREFFLANDVFDMPFRISLEEIASRVDAVDILHSSFSDFRRNVIDALVNDINDNSKDMEIYRQPEYEKVGRKYEYITFWPHRALKSIDLQEIVQGDDADVISLDAIRQQISYDALCVAYGDNDTVLLAVKIIQAAYQALEITDSAFPAKFGMTNKEMREHLDNLTMEQVLLGLQEAFKKKRRRKNVEVYILQCILDAALHVQKTSPKENNIPLVKEKLPCQYLPEQKRKRATGNQREEARRTICEQINYSNLMKAYGTVSANWNEDAAEIGREAVEDLVECIVHVMTTFTSTITISKGYSLPTQYIREVFRSTNLNYDIAFSVLHKYLNERYESIRYIENQHARRKYLLSMLWSELSVHPMC